jgi:tetratricopeptide (TPR) repeat protein
MEAGRALKDKGELRNALAELRAAARIHPEHAETRFLLARCLDALGRPEDALPHYEAARDLDAVRWRISSDYNDAVRELARRLDDPGVLLADADAYLRSRAPDGIPGAELFLEHVHPTLEGNFAIAEAIARALGESDVAPLFGEWDWARHRRFEQHAAADHVDTLDRIAAAERARRLMAVLDEQRGNGHEDELRQQIARLEGRLDGAQRVALGRARAGGYQKLVRYDWRHLYVAQEYAAGRQFGAALRELDKIKRFGFWQTKNESYAGLFVTEASIRLEMGDRAGALIAAERALSLDRDTPGAAALLEEARAAPAVPFVR